MKQRIKLYEVKFREYSDVLRTQVSDYDGHEITFSDVHYIDVEDGLIVKECDLPYFQRFGGGFQSIKFVGFLGVPEVNSSTCTAESYMSSSSYTYDPSVTYYSTASCLRIDQTTTTDHVEEDK